MEVLDRVASSTALVLAGRRPDGDPLADAHGVSHKALIPVAGQPMIERVLEAVDATAAFGRIAICIDDPDALRGVPGVRARSEAGRLVMLPARETPAASVITCLESLGQDGPILVTTGDHPLLDAEILLGFWNRALEGARADLAVGVVEQSSVRALFPSAKRTFLPVRGGAVTGANLFAFLGPEALAFARFWLQAEQHRKQPFRLLRPFGIGTLLLFALRRLDLDAAFARASRAVGAQVRPVVLEDARAALDVDREEHLALAKAVLGRQDEGDFFTHPS